MIYKFPTFRKKQFLLKSIIGIFTVMICFVTSVYVISFFLGPPPTTSEQNTIYYSQNGEIIGEEKGVESRYWVDIENISTDVINAAIAIEDKNFFDHYGFDPKRMIGAALLDLQSLSLKAGASTLTQQYARNLFLSHEKTWTRKLKEAFYTIRLEMYYSKEEILEGYLNTIYFGHGAYGIEAASRYFFGKSADQVSLAEAAMLAGIPKGPTYYSPLNDLVKATGRQKVILGQMLDQKLISETDYSSALNEKLTYIKQKEQSKQKLGPYFQDTTLQEAADILQLDHESIKSGGYKIYTTLLPNLQKQLEQKVKENINKDSDLEIGALALDPHTGAIQALVGGRSYEKSPFNRAIVAKRMSGSTFKPFLYYAALENSYTASTKLMSKPTTFSLENNETYQPNNFNGYYANAPITLAQALALSDNVYAVKTNLFLGTQTLVDTAKQFGIMGELPLVPALALGTASVSVEEMAIAYGMLANGGRKITGYTIEKIVDRHGEIVFERKNKTRQHTLDPINTFILTHLMSGMFDQTLNGHMAVTGSTVSKQLTRPYAGKSGTTKADSWMIGYSPTLVTGIWTGYDDNRSMETVGETAYAKNIWAGFMEVAHQGKPIDEFAVPAGVISVQVDPVTGQIATPYCPVMRPTYFKKGTEPKIHCQTHFPNGGEKIELDHLDDDKGILERLFEIFR